MDILFIEFYIKKIYNKSLKNLSKNTKIKNIEKKF